VSESEIRFAHTRDKVLTVLACFLAGCGDAAIG
jgi:hypothetical protein